MGGLYDARWQRARREFLAMNPMCTICRASGKLTAATLVDHVLPHRGNRELFWDVGNWQPLCTYCHNVLKQSFEKGGDAGACDIHGRPMNPIHPWNKGGIGSEETEGEG